MQVLVVPRESQSFTFSSGRLFFLSLCVIKLSLPRVMPMDASGPPAVRLKPQPDITEALCQQLSKLTVSPAGLSR